MEANASGTVNGFPERCRPQPAMSGSALAPFASRGFGGTSRQIPASTLPMTEWKTAEIAQGVAASGIVGNYFRQHDT
jgi:hypothetical protein